MIRLFEPGKVPVPPDFRKLPLDERLPVDVEIGCGVGFHPLRYARQHPDRQLVAFERTAAKFARFAGRIRGHESMPNLIPIHGDAIPWISHGFAPESVDRYLLLYPNPYPKESQRNLRFHFMPFFARLRDTLKRGGSLTMATNQEFYMREARQVIHDHWGLRLVECRELHRQAAPRSHFEKKYLERGDRCWNMIWIRS